MKVVIHGPNLSGPAQRLAQFHVHAEQCQDNRSYGPGRKNGGEDAGLNVEAESTFDVAAFIYADHLSDYGLTLEDAEGKKQIEEWISDFHFAPCCVMLAVKGSR